MAPHVESGQSAARPARPAVRGPRIVLVLVAIVCVMIGRGLGLLGGSAAPSGAAVPGASASSAGAGAPPLQEPVPAAGRAPAPAPTPPAAHAEPAQADPVPASPPSGARLDADRFASLVSLVEHHRGQGRLGAATAALERTRALALDDRQRDRLRDETRAVDQAIAAAVAQVASLVRDGAVLSARGAAERLLAEAPPDVRSRLAAAIGDAGGDPARPLVPAARPWPVPRPLGRDRPVRARLAEGLATGRVVDSRSDQVTLRLERDQGVTFPTLEVTACEPSEPTAADAVEMGLAAVQAGDALLARLWLACARYRANGGAAGDDRAARLTESLR